MANLYDKAGLVNIPVGYQDGFLYNIKPEDNTLAFRFNRDSAATRVNKEGLIEQVGYFGPELVQNGNFSELGSELVVNGDFATDSDWTKGAGWSISGGKANRSGATNNTSIRQYIPVVNGKTYKFSYTRTYISGFGQTNLYVKIDNVNYYTIGVYNSTVAEEHTVTGYFTAGFTGNLYWEIYGINDFTGSIDKVSVKQVDPNDYWYASAPWSITNQGAFYDDTSANRLDQSNLNLLQNKLYKLTFDIENTTGTEAFIWIGNAGGSINYTGTNYEFYKTGSRTFYFTMPSDQTTLAFYGSLTGGPFYINNISLVEVQGDKPRIDYTDSLTSPSFLLEPQSTNLVTFSEDFSQWGLGDAQLLSATHTNPDGTTSAKVLAYNGGTNQHYMSFSPSVSSGQDYTFSIFVKAKELKYVCLIFLNDVAGRYFDLENGTLLGSEFSVPSNSRIEDFGNGWYRCSITDSATSTTKFSGIYLSQDGTSIGPYIPGTSTDGLYVWGAQIEESSYPTSYIPTSGSTVTRAEETCNGAGSASTFNSTEGVLYAEIAAFSSEANNEYISISDGTNDERVVIGYVGNNNIRLFVKSGGTFHATTDISLSNALDYNKIAFKYKSGDNIVYLNGNKVNTDTDTYSLSAFNVLQFSTGNALSNHFYGKTKGVYVFNEALTDDELQQLTGPEYNSFAALAAAYNYTVI